MIVRFKKLSRLAKAPERANPDDAGWDLRAIGFTRNPENPGVLIYKTGIGVEIPKGHVGILKERSSLRNKPMSLIGGVIDCGYTGEIQVSFHVFADASHDIYEAGDKICQLVIAPIAQVDCMEQVDDFSETERGLKGFGSSDLAPILEAQGE